MTGTNEEFAVKIGADKIAVYGFLRTLVHLKKATAAPKAKEVGKKGKRSIEYTVDDALLATLGVK